MDTINERFRSLREHLGLSQEEFAAKVHRTRSEIKNIEYGKTAPKEEIIASVCSAYGVMEEWLRHGLEPMMAAKTQEEEITELVGRAFEGDSDFQQAFIRMICSRNKDELKVLEDAFRVVYESLK